MSLRISCLSAIAMFGCSGDRDVSISFQPLLNGQPLRCGTQYSGVGVTQSTFDLLDLKMFVSDVVLIDAGGGSVPLALDQDRQWQRDDIALLDFEDGTGSCNTGSPQTNTTIRGTVTDGDYRKIRFTLGIPAEMNHLDAATAPAPLNEPGMWWDWKGGYKFVRLDAKTRGNASYYFHLGADACTGEVSSGFSCSSGNQIEIALDHFDLARPTISLDVGTLWSAVDLDHQIDNATDFIQGCMSDHTDPECSPVFAALGMSVSGTPSGTQRVFAAEGAP
jgi:uncharacterized repeat protein (TIGR04052 family)